MEPQEQHTERGVISGGGVCRGVWRLGCAVPWVIRLVPGPSAAAAAFSAV